MNFKSTLIAAAVAFASLGTQAADTHTDFFADGNAWVYEFGADQISAADALAGFTFVLDSTAFADFASLVGKYSMQGDVSGTAFKVTGVKLNGAPWNLSAGTSNINIGQITLSSGSSIEIQVSGLREGSGANFQGSLVLTPVPEPETYAMLLAGLGAVAFVARRRKV